MTTGSPCENTPDGLHIFPFGTRPGARKCEECGNWVVIEEMVG